MRRDVFQAIADPTRRSILGMVAFGAKTTIDLSVHFDISRQAVSRHIKILVECNLLKQKQAGRKTFYQYNPKKLKEVDQWIYPFRKTWEPRFEQLEIVLKNLKN
jgi:DNA-binding transcriptional ArsR family regulator